jgi:hypothetical protein
MALSLRTPRHFNTGGTQTPPLRPEAPLVPSSIIPPYTSDIQARAITNCRILRINRTVWLAQIMAEQHRSEVHASASQQHLVTQFFR